MNFKNYLLAGYPVIWVNTLEPGRAERELFQVAVTTRKDLRGRPVQSYHWDILTGLAPLSATTGEHGLSVVVPGKEAKKVGPAEVVTLSAAAPEGTVTFLWNLHRWTGNSEVIQAIENALPLLKSRKTTLVILAPNQDNLTVELSRQVLTMEFALPNKDELGEVFRRLAPNLKGIKVTDHQEAVTEAGLGLLESEAEDAFALSYVESNGGLDTRVIAREKAGALTRKASLVLSQSTVRFADIGGLERVKDFCLTTAVSPMSLGVLLMGVPGAGKTTLGEALGNELGIPTLLLDFGSLFSSLQGETEGAIRSALGAVDAIGRCVLLVDELGDGLAGVKGSGELDSGTAKRTGSRFLKWLSTREPGKVYVVGTCFTEDTIIACDGGRLPNIRQVFSQQVPAPLTATAEGVAVSDLAGGKWNKVSKLLEVVTSSAITRCTPEHRFFRWCSTGMQEVQANELAPGDFLASPRVLPHGENSLGDDLSYMLGYSVGDGSVHNNRRRITWFESNAQHVLTIAGLCEEVFGKAPGLHWAKDRGVAHIYLDSKEILTKLLTRFPELALDSLARICPDEVCRGDSITVSNFLAGLFDADGTVNQHISFTTISQKLAQQVVLLLRRFGIMSSLYRNRKVPNNAYTVSMAGQQAVDFMHHIGFRITKKHELGMKLHAGYRSGYTLGCIPVDWQVLKTLGLPPKWMYSTSSHNLTHTVPRLRLEAAASLLSTTSSAVSDWLAYDWQKIKSISALEGEWEVYDLTTIPNHTYLANGLLVHNCNTLATLPPQFIRSERWDGLFFFDLPSRNEKDAIWSIWGRRYLGEAPGDNRPEDEGWTGADIKSCCRVAAMRQCDLGAAAGFIVPVTRTMDREITDMREWAKGRCLPASKLVEEHSRRSGRNISLN